MKRFILLSFVFMGLAFYELSGGSDFDPNAARIVVVEERMQRETARKAEQPVMLAAAPRVITDKPAEPAAAEPTALNSTETVTRSSLNLVSFETIANADQVVALPPVVREDSLQAGLPEPEPKLDVTALQNPPATLRSIAFSGNVISSAPDEEISDADIRIVKGSLVNMRSGPGTDYEIVDQLSQSTRVEVLSDNGNGWVELRPVDGGATGWIAAFLLSEG